MVKEPVEDGTGSGHVAEELAPFVDGTIGGHECGAVFVTAHDDFQKDFAAFGREDFQTHVVR